MKIIQNYKLLPLHKHIKHIQAFCLAGIEQKLIQPYRPTGLKNYVCKRFFFFFFLPFFLPFFLSTFLEIKHTRLPPHRHYKKPQAGHLTGINKLVQTYHSTGLRQTHKLIAPQAAKLQVWHHTDVNKTTRLPPDRQQNYKLAATQAKNYKLTATQAKDYKLAATQA